MLIIMNFVFFCPEQDYQIERSQRLSVSSIENSSTPIDAELETMVTKVLSCLHPMCVQICQ